MAPASFMAHRSFGLVTDLGKHIDQDEVLLKRYKIYEKLLTERIREWTMKNCGKPEFINLSEKSLFLIFRNYSIISGIAPRNCNYCVIECWHEIISYIMDSKLAPVDLIRSIIELKQNLELNGSESVPPYNFSKIWAPVIVYFVQNDRVFLLLDVLK